MGIKGKSILKNKIIKLMPIEKDGGMNPEGHDGYFMYSDTMVRYVVPISKSKGTLINPLTPDEKDFLEKELEENLNIHKKTDNFWRKFEIVIRKDDNLMENGYKLDLSDPIDYIRYKVLQIQESVAPSWEARYDKGGYKFALVDESQIIDAEAENVDMKKDAYIYIGQIETSRKKMSDFLRVFGRRVSGDVTIEYLKTEIAKLIDRPSTLKKMHDLINDEDFEMRVFIEDALACGAIIKSNNKYQLPGGDYLNPNKPNLEGTIYKLKQLKKATDEIYLMISTQIKEA